jgi:hypothetical protein
MGFLRLRILTMQILHFMPDIDDLALSKASAISVIELLIQPFGTIQATQEFWHNYPCILVCLTEKDEPETALSSLDDTLLHLVELAEHSFEFVEPLPKGYQLSLAIISAEGSGIYLIKPRDMNITQE